MSESCVFFHQRCEEVSWSFTEEVFTYAPTALSWATGSSLCSQFVFFMLAWDFCVTAWAWSLKVFFVCGFCFLNHGLKLWHYLTPLFNAQVWFLDRFGVYVLCLQRQWTMSSAFLTIVHFSKSEFSCASYTAMTVPYCVLGLWERKDNIIEFGSPWQKYLEEWSHTCFRLKMLLPWAARMAQLLSCGDLTIWTDEQIWDTSVMHRAHW